MAEDSLSVKKEEGQAQESVVTKKSCRNSFVFYKDWYYAIKDFDSKTRLEIFEAIISKAFNLENVELSPLAEMAMKFIRPQLERDNDKWVDICDKRKEAGRLGGLAKQANGSKSKQMVAKGSKGKQTLANLADNDNDNDNDIQDTNVSMSIKEIEKLKKENDSLKSENEELKKRKAKKDEIAKFDVRDDLSYVDDRYSSIWQEWLDYKDKINKQYKTQIGATKAYAHLMKLSNYNIEKAKAIIEQSIIKSWDGFFDVKDWKPSEEHPTLFENVGRKTIIAGGKEWQL